MNLSAITDPNEMAGIEREIRIHTNLDHPNIVKLHDSFIQGCTVYMVMDYVENGNLYQYLQ